MYASAATVRERYEAAVAVLARLESSKLRGADYSVDDIVALRRLCQVRAGGRGVCVG